MLAVRAVRPALELEVITRAIQDSRADLAAFNEIAERQCPYDAPQPEAKPHVLTTIVTDEAGKRPRIDGTVRVASGPWLVEDAWWSDAPTDRAYWDVEVSDGGLYRIYRDRRTDQWFADGIYD